MGVPYRTFKGWFEKYEKFGDGVPEKWKYFAELAEMYKVTKQVAKEVYKEMLICKAEAGLEKRITGYEYEEKKTFYEKKKDRSGNEMLIPNRLLITKKQVHPSVPAIIFTLKKLLPEIYGDRSLVVNLNPHKSPYENMSLEEIEAEIAKLELLNNLN